MNKTRELKFKFWLGHTQKMTYEHSLQEISNCFWDFTEDIIALQYTGLKDKNGIEIYEGDINQDKGVVIWNQDNASFMWEYKDVETMEFGEESDWCEIIGNIYEMPHLVE